MSTGIVILAAGESTRMGEPKQLLAYRGTTLLQHTIETARTLAAPIVVVLGAHAAQIREQLGESGVLIGENPAWRDGMGGSLRAGLSALLDAHPDTDTAIFLLCDQPFLSTEILNELIATHARTGSLIVASKYNDTLAAPALFARELFPELLALHSTGGAQQIIRKHRDHAVGISFPGGAIDLDTRADYQSLRELSTPIPV